jgi:hypothetical protein
MTGLVALSLILHVFSFYLIYQLRNERSESQKQLSRLTEYIEETLALFSADMQEENDKILESINNIKSFSVPAPAQLTESSNKNDEGKRAATEMPVSKLSAEQEKIILLAEDGLDSVEIAKVMNKGKGEVDLLLKFYR